MNPRTAFSIKLVSAELSFFGASAEEVFSFLAFGALAEAFASLE